MQRREASINDAPIRQADRLFRWPQSPRPVEHPGLSELGRSRSAAYGTIAPSALTYSA